MRVLITGGAGSIGSHLVETLLWRGDEVVVLDDLSGGTSSNLRYVDDFAGLELVEGSVLDEELVNNLVASVDAIVHLAGSAAEQGERGRLETDVQGTINVLSAARPP